MSHHFIFSISSKKTIDTYTALKSLLNDLSKVTDENHQGRVQYSRFFIDREKG